MPIYNWPRMLMVAQTAGSAITAAAETSALPAHAKYTFEPDYFNFLGQAIRICASGKISSVITTPGTARWKVKLGANIAFDGAAVLLDSVAGRTDNPWTLDIKMYLRAVGTSANFMGYGEFKCEDILGVAATAPKGGLVAVLPWAAAPAVGANFDAKASQQADLTFTQTAATGSMTLETFHIEALN